MTGVCGGLSLWGGVHNVFGLIEEACSNVMTSVKNPKQPRLPMGSSVLE